MNAALVLLLDSMESSFSCSMWNSLTCLCRSCCSRVGVECRIVSHFGELIQWIKLKLPRCRCCLRRLMSKFHVRSVSLSRERGERISLPFPHLRAKLSNFHLVSSCLGYCQRSCNPLRINMITLRFIISVDNERSIMCCYMCCICWSVKLKWRVALGNWMNSVNSQ